MGKIPSLEEFSVLFGTDWRRRIPSFDLSSSVNWMLKAWHTGWQDSARFSAVCVKVFESQCMMGTTVWPPSVVRKYCSNWAAASHMLSLTKIYLASGYAWSMKCTVNMFVPFTLSALGEKWIIQIDCIAVIRAQLCLSCVGKWINGYEYISSLVLH